MRLEEEDKTFDRCIQEFLNLRNLKEQFSFLRGIKDMQYSISSFAASGFRSVAFSGDVRSSIILLGTASSNQPVHTE